MSGPFRVPGAGLLGEDRFVPTRDGRWLRTMVAGNGAADDLVVLEAGMGFSGLYWEPVHRELADHARVVAYDRSGLGGSPTDRAPRTLDRLARDLVDVVHAFPHRRLVLVGHSWGGPIVRRATLLLLEEKQRAAGGGSAANGDSIVAGVVLVDPSDENADLYFRRSTAVSMRLNGLLVGGMSRVGLLRRMVHRMGDGLPAAVRDATARASATTEAATASAAESATFRTDLRALREADWEPREVPIRLVSGTRPGRGEGRLRRELVAAHRQTAQTHAQVEFVEAAASSHLVPVTEPELVVEQVRGFLGSTQPPGTAS